MRSLKIKPARDITELALSPDGQRFGVIQSYHGFRMYDAVTGTELGEEPEHGFLTVHSPTSRHYLSALFAQIRLAEMAGGRLFAMFQEGWTRGGEFNRPPIAPNTLALPSKVTVGAVVFDRWHEPPRPPTSPGRAYLEGALSADHRFAVGRFLLSDKRMVVCDLAHEVIVATDLDLSASSSGSEFVRTAFSPDGTRIIAVTRSTLFAFDLPSVDLTAIDLPLESLVLKPVVVIHTTQPQPILYPIPPFAVLPCGQKVLMRGARSRVELRDLTTGELLTAWKWLRKVNSLAVAGDGLTAAAGGARGQVVIWDLE